MPVEAGVEHALVHVARHLLGAYERAGNIRIVDGGKIVAGPDGDIPAGAFEEFDGGVLEASLRDAEFELVHVFLLLTFYTQR